MRWFKAITSLSRLDGTSPLKGEKGTGAQNNTSESLLLLLRTDVLHIIIASAGNSSSLEAR